MSRISAGLLLYRIREGHLQVLLVHPGGPFWKNKDQGAWSIPKGEAPAGEDLLAAACREFEEELGSRPTGDFRPLTATQQRGGKIVHCWAVEGDLDTRTIKCNTFTMEWPPRSGRSAEFPEVDRAEFFDVKWRGRRSILLKWHFSMSFSASLRRETQTGYVPTFSS